MSEARHSQIWRTILVLTAVSLFAFPAQAKYSGGAGEPNDPYQIATAADLIGLGETPGDYDKHFILTADIDLDPNLPGRKIFDKAVIAADANDATWWFEGTSFSGVPHGRQCSPRMYPNPSVIIFPTSPILVIAKYVVFAMDTGLIRSLL